MLPILLLPVAAWPGAKVPGYGQMISAMESAESTRSNLSNV